MKPFHTASWFLVLVIAPVLFAGSPARISPDLLIGRSDEEVAVIVQYRVPEHAIWGSRQSRAAERSLDIIRSASGRLTRSEILEAANDPNVEAIHPDRAVTASSASKLDYAWMSLLNISSPQGSAAYDGTGIGVAVIDSGIDTTNPVSNSDFMQASGFMGWFQSPTVVYSQNFVAGESNVTDTFGHGTHVAGIVAGSGANSSHWGSTYVVRGIAPGVNLINLRVLNEKGVGADSAVIQAIQTAISLKSKYNIRVINLSLGRAPAESYVNDPLCQAVQQAWNAGIVVVVAAGNFGRNSAGGNSGYGTIAAPANSPYVITVGAMNTVGSLTRSDDKMASYSSKGPSAFDFVVKPDLVAPGNQILSVRAVGSTLDVLYPQNEISQTVYSLLPGFSDKYFQLSGTSMAAPMVSGAAALLLQQNSSLTPDQVKAKLMMTADKTFTAAQCPKGVTCASPAMEATTATDAVTGVTYTSYYDVFTVGAGYLNINAALTSKTLPPSNLTAASPVAAYNSSTGAVSLLTGKNVIWGSNSSFASNVVWGSSVLSGSNIIWGSNVIWGSSAAAACNIIWGSNVVWGSQVMASEDSTIAFEGEN